MNVAFPMATIQHVQMNVAFPMVTTRHVQMHVVFPMVMDQHVKMHVVFPMVTIQHVQMHGASRMEIIHVRNAIANMPMDGPLTMESCVELREVLQEFSIARLGERARAPLSGVLALTHGANLNCVTRNAIVRMRMDQEQEIMESGVD